MADHEHSWLPDALCQPVQRDHAIVLFRCRGREGGCGAIAYGHAAPDEIRETRAQGNPGRVITR